jgi:putative photosynthetic complex assembly protein 2
MLTVAIPLAAAALVWWAATGVLLRVVALPRATHGRSFAVVSVLGLVGLWGLARAGGETGAGAAYAAFGCAILVWAWQEAAFLLGFVTGLRVAAPPRGAPRWQRFVRAFAALLWHELAMALGAALVLALTWDASNRVGAWTYLVLWVMRISAQLNLFLGVRNRGAELLPPHLRHLDAYFEHRPINGLWPLSVIGGAAASWLMLEPAFGVDADVRTVTERTLVATLLALAVIEHLVMVLPLRIDGWFGAAPPAATAPTALGEPGRNEP